MSVALYADVHFPGPVVRGLRKRGVDVITAQEEGLRRAKDPALLDRATLLGRAFVTQDQDLLAEAAHRQSIGQSFAGVVFSPQMGVTVGSLVKDIEMIAKVYDPIDIQDRVEYLPL